MCPGGGSAKPAMLAKRAKPAKPAERAKRAKRAKSAKLAKLAKLAKRAKRAKRAKSAKLAKRAKRLKILTFGDPAGGWQGSRKCRCKEEPPFQTWGNRLLLQIFAGSSAQALSPEAQLLVYNLAEESHPLNECTWGAEAPEGSLPWPCLALTP